MEEFGKFGDTILFLLNLYENLRAFSMIVSLGKPLLSLEWLPYSLETMSDSLSRTTGYIYLAYLSYSPGENSTLTLLRLFTPASAWIVSTVSVPNFSVSFLLMFSSS